MRPMQLPRQRKRLSTVLAALAVAFLANPNFGCGRDQKGVFTFGEAELRAAIEGTWRVSGTFDGAPVTVDFTLSQARAGEVPQPLVITPYCESRTFVRPAAACAESTSMPLVGTVTVGRADLLGRRISGDLRVFGLSFGHASLDLVVMEKFRIRATLEGGAIEEAHVVGTEIATPATLQRLSTTPPR